MSEQETPSIEQKEPQGNQPQVPENGNETDSNEKGDKFDISSLIEEIKKDIAQEEDLKKQEELKGKKEFVKEIYKDMSKTFEEKEKKYQEEVAKLNKKNDEIAKRLESLSNGSKSDQHEENPFKQEANKPLSQEERMSLIKKDLIRRGILNH